MNRMQRQRERWFLEGAAARRRYLMAIGGSKALPQTGEYACPCCMRLYGRDALSNGMLTLEDVPPKSAGGRRLVLTCEPCNSTAGTRLDEQARLREEQLDFLAGRAPDRALAAKIMVGGTTTGGGIRRVGDAWLLLVDPKRSNPKQHTEMNNTLEGWAAGNHSDGRPMGFELTKQVQVVRAELSWVRAAYLAAFAALGWRYIDMPYLVPLREQLAHPDATLLPPLALFNPDAAPDSRGLFVVQEPHVLRSLAVVLGRRTIFLPGLEDPQPFASIASALSNSPVQLTSSGPPGRRQIPWRGKQISWPTQPMYALDQ